MRAAIDIKAMFDMRHNHTGRFGVDQGSVRASRQQRVLTHPEKISLELIGGLNRMRSGCNHITAAGIDFVEARWLGARLLRCDLTGAEFSNAKHGARLHGSKLDSVLGATALAGAIIDSTQLVPLATGLFGGLGIVIDDTPEQDGGRS